MGLNQEQKDSIKKVAKEAAKEVAKGLALGIAAKLIGNLLATSYEKQSIKGKEERQHTLQKVKQPCKKMLTKLQRLKRT